MYNRRGLADSRKGGSQGEWIRVDNVKCIASVDEPLRQCLLFLKYIIFTKNVRGDRPGEYWPIFPG